MASASLRCCVGVACFGRNILWGFCCSGFIYSCSSPVSSILRTSLYCRFNKLLAGSTHIICPPRVIAALHEKVPACPRALSDQFANEWVLKRALGQRHIPVQLEQRTKAESDVAVAAASILARDRFVQWMQQTAAASGCPMPLGCAPHVTRAAQHFVTTHGRERLQDVAKLHFKVTQKLK